MKEIPNYFEIKRAEAEERELNRLLVREIKQLKKDIRILQHIGGEFFRKRRQRVMLLSWLLLRAREKLRQLDPSFQHDIIFPENNVGKIGPLTPQLALPTGYLGISRATILILLGFSGTYQYLPAGKKPVEVNLWLEN